MDYIKLDNPVWYSLTETHYSFAIDYGNIKFYQPGFCPFGGFTTEHKIEESIDRYSLLTDNFFIVGPKPIHSEKVRIQHELVCLQMIAPEKILLSQEEKIITLTDHHVHDLYQLVNLVQPGYFKEKTFLLGNYYGIFKDNRLIAVTGERMKMDGLVEVSAVITHPDHIGKGYAKQLVAHTVNEIFNRGEKAYLHVAATNIPAIRLYERLGFVTRRKISFWNIVCR